ncbi:MAG: rhodanese-like domain-containing protein [Phycisphaerales bacterium]|nr:rhodanese-like domain-containing protein [Phycisphaerales bacterium]
MSPRTWWFTPVLALAAWLLASCGEKRVDDSDITFIDLTQLRALMDEDRGNPDRLVIIDPRIPGDYSAGHIPGAVNIRLTDVQRNTGRDPAISRHDYIVVYGNDPGSAIAKGMAKELLHRRYSKVRWFQGGLAEWRKAGFRVESSAE